MAPASARASRRRDLAPYPLDLVDLLAARPFELRQALLTARERRDRLGLLDPCVREAAGLLSLGRKPLERCANLGGARPHRGRALLEPARRVELAGDRLVAPLELRGVGQQRSIGRHARILAAGRPGARFVDSSREGLPFLRRREPRDRAVLPRVRYTARRGSAPAGETRKVVTIVFSDLKGSTSLGEALDSEALREVMTRYFDAMREELERHGGVIEKFIGDAVMAVFEALRLHEDDALRAVRAAASMQSALAELNGELEQVYGVQLANRTGVNTGEVVAGDPTTGQRLVTGDAVNVAARLEQAAGEREVLLGALTYRLVRDHIEVEEVEPLALKGKAEPVPAYRLVGVRDTSDVDVRRGAPLVGRDDELALLDGALAEAETAGHRAS